MDASISFEANLSRRRVLAALGAIEMALKLNPRGFEFSGEPLDFVDRFLGDDVGRIVRG